MIVERFECEHGYSRDCPDCDVPSYLPAVLSPASRDDWLTDDAPVPAPLSAGCVASTCDAGESTDGRAPVDDGPADNWGAW